MYIKEIFKLLCNHPDKFIRVILLKYARLVNNQKLLLKLLYKEHIGLSLNLRNPKRFTEKIQWLKLYDHNSLYHIMVDKYEVKKWVAERIGDKYIIPTIGIYNSFDDIDFTILPNRFVLKNTIGGGGSGVVICNDKRLFDFNKAKGILQNSMKYDIYKSLGEWAYKGLSSRIIVEEFMSNNGKPLQDYKFFCFNGIPKFFYIAQDRFNEESKAPIFDFYDMECNLLPFTNYGYRSSGLPSIQINRFSEMIKIASKLSEGMAFLRVDLYLINDQVFFGETTFYHDSGLYSFTPDIYDKKIGELLDLAVVHQ